MTHTMQAAHAAAPAAQPASFHWSALSGILAYVPGTRRWKRRCRIAIRSRVKDRLAMLWLLTGLESDQKVDLENTFRKRELAVADVEVSSDGFTFCLAFLTILAVIVGIVWLSYRPAIDAARLKLPGESWLTGSTLGGFLSVLGGVILLGWLRLEKLNVVVFSLPFLVSALIFGSAWWGHPGLSLADAASRHPRALTFMLGAAYMPVFLAAALPALSLGAMYRTYLTRQRADAQLTNLILIATFYAEHRWDIAYRSRSGFVLAGHLERIANCLEHDITAAMPGRSETAQWFRDTLQGKAAAVRALKKWALTPKVDTKPYLVARLAGMLVGSLRGDLDSFETAPLPVLTPKSVGKRILSFLSALPSAAVPGLVAWAFTRVGILKDPFVTYVTVAAILWAVAVLIPELDSRYGERLDFLERVRHVWLRKTKDE